MKWLRERLCDAGGDGGPCILTADMETSADFEEVPVIFPESVVRIVDEIVPCLIDRKACVRRDAERLLAIGFRADRKRTTQKVEKRLASLKAAQRRAAEEGVGRARQASDSGGGGKGKSREETRERARRKEERVARSGEGSVRGASGVRVVEPPTTPSSTLKTPRGYRERGPTEIPRSAKAKKIVSGLYA